MVCCTWSFSGAQCLDSRQRVNKSIRYVSMNGADLHRDRSSLGLCFVRVRPRGGCRGAAPLRLPGSALVSRLTVLDRLVSTLDSPHSTPARLRSRRSPILYLAHAKMKPAATCVAMPCASHHDIYDTCNTTCQHPWNDMSHLTTGSTVRASAFARGHPCSSGTVRCAERPGRPSSMIEVLHNSRSTRTEHLLGTR
jgi:hypothetical protein